LQISKNHNREFRVRFSSSPKSNNNHIGSFPTWGVCQTYCLY